MDQGVLFGVGEGIQTILNPTDGKAIGGQRVRALTGAI
jgi:hypothetical protein